MFDEKTILARLQNGEDIQNIANEMAATINAANKIYTDQKAAEEASKAAAAKAKIQKKEELQEIIDLFLDWFESYYDIEVKKDITADQIIELIDSVQDYIEAIKDFESMLGVKKAKSTAPIGTKIIKNNIKTKNADEQLNDFLKKMGW